MIFAPRAAVTRSAAVALVAGLALSACSGSSDKSATSSTSASSSSTTTTTPVPTPTGVTVVGAPAPLAAVVTKLYAGKTGRATATLGKWHGRQLAVVTLGKDVTLATAEPTWKVVGGWWPSLGKPTPQVGGKRFVLMMGSDARVSQGQKIQYSRADALQVVGVDGHGGGGILGMARDLWVPLSTGGTDKINAAMVHGGPKAQVQTIANVTGLPIQGYLVMSFGQVTSFVNRMGGLPIIIEKALNGIGIPIHLSAGPHKLTGSQFLGYARERKALPDGDFGRSRHQSLLLLATAANARRLGPTSLPKALTALDTSSASNLTAAQMLTFAAATFVLDPRKVGHSVAKGSFDTSSDGQSIVRLDGASRSTFAAFRDGRL